MRADLALIGFGNVGRRFATLIASQADLLRRDYDLELRVVAIATQRHGAAGSAQGLDAGRAAAVLESGASLDTVHPRPLRLAGSDDAIALLASSDSPIRVVVETTTLSVKDGRPAIDHVEAGIRRGCHVVTANKGPAAFAYRRLRALAEAAGVSFLFEGAVMDGVPIFNLVRETLPTVEITGYRGVINTTTSYILSMLESGEPFEPALQFMRQEGIAEADASLDLDGWDAAAKAAALANVLLEADITPHDVSRERVGPDAADRALRAMAEGKRLRVVASCRRDELPRVALHVLPPDDLLAGLRGTANALVLQTDLLGEIAITQLEGSLTQTAYALLTDLVTIRRRMPAPGSAPTGRNP